MSHAKQRRSQSETLAPLTLTHIPNLPVPVPHYPILYQKGALNRQIENRNYFGAADGARPCEQQQHTQARGGGRSVNRRSRTQIQARGLGLCGTRRAIWDRYRHVGHRMQKLIYAIGRLERLAIYREEELLRVVNLLTYQLDCIHKARRPDAKTAEEPRPYWRFGFRRSGWQAVVVRVGGEMRVCREF